MALLRGDMWVPDPDEYRGLEEVVRDFLQDQGFWVRKMGVEHRPHLSRWSPDFFAVRNSFGVWADAKLRNPEYVFFLLEEAPLALDETFTYPVVFALVTRDLVIDGWISVTEARRHQGELLNHVRDGRIGTRDPYRQIPARQLRDFWSAIDTWEMPRE